jgi:hypothetical protein
MDKYNPYAHMSMEEIFHKFLPETLYESHYSLSQTYGHTPQEWRTFLRDNHVFIDTELAAIAEAEARSALSRLGNASGTEVAAIKALLETSKLINDSQKQNTKIVMTFIPDAHKPEQKQVPSPIVSSLPEPEPEPPIKEPKQPQPQPEPEPKEEEYVDPFASF